MSVLNSVASEIAIRKLLFLWCLITDPIMASTVRNSFESRAESYFDKNLTSAGLMLSISEVLVKYDLYNISNHGLTAPRFQPTQIGKEFSEIGSKSLRGTHGLTGTRG